MTDAYMPSYILALPLSHIEVNFGKLKRTSVGNLGEDISAPLPCRKGKNISAENGPVHDESAHSYA